MAIDSEVAQFLRAVLRFSGRRVRGRISELPHSVGGLARGGVLTRLEPPPPPARRKMGSGPKMQHSAMPEIKTTERTPRLVVNWNEACAGARFNNILTDTESVLGLNVVQTP